MLIFFVAFKDTVNNLIAVGLKLLVKCSIQDIEYLCLKTECVWLSVWTSKQNLLDECLDVWKKKKNPNKLSTNIKVTSKLLKIGIKVSCKTFGFCRTQIDQLVVLIQFAYWILIVGLAGYFVIFMEILILRF